MEARAEASPFSGLPKWNCKLYRRRQGILLYAILNTGQAKFKREHIEMGKETEISCNIIWLVCKNIILAHKPYIFCDSKGGNTYRACVIRDAVEQKTFSNVHGIQIHNSFISCLLLLL